MRRSTGLALVLIVALFLGFQVIPALSEEAESMSPRGPEASKFLDEGRLVRTLMRDDALRVDAFRARRDAAQARLDRALDAGAPEEVIDELRMNLRRAQAALTQAEEDFTAEQRRITRQVNAMSDDQVFAMNRSLNNTLHNGLIPRIGSDDVMRILDEDFDARQINAFTKAFEAEAQAERKARRFREKYRDSDKEQFLRQAEFSLEKGEDQKAKFLAKVDRFGGAEATATRDARAATREAARQAGKDAQRLAKEAAKESAKEAARSAARDSAKQAAKAQARQEAKQLAKAESNKAGRGLAKGKNK